MKRSHPLLALLACLMISASQAQPASTVTAPVRCQSAPPVACEGSRLPTLLEYRAGEVYLQVFCQAEKESIESALDASGQPIWSLVGAVGALDTQPDALSAAIRRYRIRAGALTALRTTANPALIARLDADVLAASDASVACLDSERIGFFASAPSGADGTKCPAAHWPLWSAYQPLQLQQRWFDDPADLRDVLRHGPATAPWSYEGIAGCTPRSSTGKPSVSFWPGGRRSREATRRAVTPRAFCFSAPPSPNAGGVEAGSPGLARTRLPGGNA